MGIPYLANDVFKPYQYPLHTYVIRKTSGNETYEARLERSLKIPGLLISITGSSKSGKSVLCQRVIGERTLPISGSHIKSTDDFWEKTAEKLDMPIETEFTITQGHEKQGVFEGGGKLKIPFMADASAKSNLSQKQTISDSIKEKQPRSYNQILEDVKERNLVLVIDDFHYIAADVQMYIARVLKDAIFSGLKAVIVSLPHRSDDAIRRNPDLIGRIRAIDIEPWGEEELQEIAHKGFQLLEVTIPEPFINLLVKESIASPQLMQMNCLNLTFPLELEEITRNSISDARSLIGAFRETTRDLHHNREVFQKIQAGPNPRGKQRNQYELADGKIVDVYGAILCAIADDPPEVSLTLQEVRHRINSMLSPGTLLLRPVSISNALDQIDAILKRSDANYKVMEWKDQKLYILDPYFLFYLRWSEPTNIML